MHICIYVMYKTLMQKSTNLFNLSRNIRFGWKGKELYVQKNQFAAV